MAFTSIIELVSKLAPVIFGILLMIIALLAYFRRGKVKIGNFSLDLSPTKLDAEIARVRSRLDKARVGDTSDKQFVLLEEYHAQGLAQARISFWFSLLFASIGFAVIIAAVAIMDKSVALAEQGRTWLTLVAGTVIDAVAGLFFVQSNKARQLMVDFFDRLRNDRKLEEALNIATRLPDSLLRSRLGVILALSLAETAPSDALVASIFRSPAVDTGMGNMPTNGARDVGGAAASEYPILRTSPDGDASIPQV